ncbi:MAG: hypothetical protein A3A98_03775 [Candidatus Staskawiczbacteria bacterium RIFCSPLOWO2_01_FULL_40_39]|uniref:Uncharacterized protein n=1 Tax=Candidatus Staskawiczbacteria bacterium RIFCSPHIGHO2_01_FULL_39_25 TaxID=1802202 RepID=A0A1G2HNI3_9BACT|nr:MAG: hypothetical protein A2730_02990 [Candidatus Staskawiczbacteria bacterium RIFCSPHIGHO2_01_FULL_39_25]OGZ73529.1 MAG: hypothetical protein A3A98_03775 [Candidatus Staskawiczbacteria bacterium RIFCSPLOWO2_01_FULL_40_39]OGZ75416.1 MAG: hypothetical protein A3I87_03175 [Candidatus Staskawiczbacteria bacterium RIFCSPLOWO2_02_FULL_39_8]
MPIDINAIIYRFLDMVLWPIFGGLVIVMFIYAGILFVTAQGDPSKISTARKAVLWAVVGIIVAFVAFSAVKLMREILGV